MVLRDLHIPAVLVIAGIATAFSGVACIQPEDTFKDFGERYDTIDEASDPSATASVSTGLIVGCIPPAPGSVVEGTYLFALSAQLINEKPLFFKADVTFGDPAAPSITIALTPLRTPYREGTDNAGIANMTELPPALTIGTFPLSPEGEFSGNLPKDLEVTGKANPFSPNNLVASITLDAGQVCEVNEGEAPRVICGTLSGEVTKPIPLDLDGDNYYAMVKYDGTTLPDPIIFNCAADPAAPF